VRIPEGRLGPGLLAAAFMALAIAAPGAAQIASQSAGQPSASVAAPPATQPGAQADALPLMKAPEKPENPLSRLEIVSLGSFPIMLFYTGFVFDLGRFFANNFDTAYAPWPIQSSYSAPLSESDRVVRLGVALGASFAVGGIDAYLHQAKLKKARRLHDAAVELRE